MSNNSEIDFDGTSYFFAYYHALMVADISERPQVGLTFPGANGLLGFSLFFVAIEGEARFVRVRDAFAARWHSDLDRWFEQGVDTPGLVLIEVTGSRMHYWDGGEDGEEPL